MNLGSNIDVTHDQSQHANLIRNPSGRMDEEIVLVIPETIKIKGKRINLSLSPKTHFSNLELHFEVDYIKSLL